jgi:predicted RNA-binding Zn-ribbon protein involved in translation (DUF1610 family)
MKGYVFISYSSRNITFVSKLIAEMKKNNIPYWKAPEKIPPGSNYAKEIPRAIAGSTATILIVSKESQSSIWVEKEIDLAVCERKTIIPIMIDETPLNDMYRFYLNNVQMVQYNPDRNHIVRNAIKCIMDLKSGDAVRIKPDANAASDESTDKKKAAGKDVRLQKAEKSNALRINRIPVKCTLCGCELQQQTMGIYKCASCGKEYYDDFQKIRNYIEKNGAAPASVICAATGVPLRTIDYFFKEEYLEIPLNDTIRLECARCGAPIRTGTLCDKCKSGMENIKKKDKWHSGVWKK